VGALVVALLLPPTAADADGPTDGGGSGFAFPEPSHAVLDQTDVQGEFASRDTDVT
jgi:hypothetical protein